MDIKQFERFFSRFFIHRVGCSFIVLFMGLWSVSGYAAEEDCPEQWVIENPADLLEASRALSLDGGCGFDGVKDVIVFSDNLGAELLIGDELRFRGTDDLDILGPGADVLNIRFSENAERGVPFYFYPRQQEDDSEKPNILLSGLSISDDYGLAVAVEEANLTVDSLIISNREGDTDSLGVAGEDSNLTIINTDISNNRITRGSAYGIAVYLEEGSLVIINSTINRNEMDITGGDNIVYGAVALFSASLLIEESEISNNKIQGIGSAVFSYDYDGAERSEDRSFIIRDSLIQGNLANEGTLAFYFEADMELERSLLIENSLIASNQNFGAGALLVGAEVDSEGNEETNGLQVKVVNSTISNNLSSGVGSLLPSVAGMGFFGDFINVQISHSTVVNNGPVNPAVNSLDAGGILMAKNPFYYDDGNDLQFSTLTLDHSIVANNSLGVTDGELNPELLFLDFAEPLNLSVNYSLLGTAVSQDVVGLLDAVSVSLMGQDPLLGPLVDNGGNSLTHKPEEASPVLDAGDPDLLAGADSVPETDQRGVGFARISGADPAASVIDLGALEVQFSEGDGSDDGGSDDGGTNNPGDTGSEGDSEPAPGGSSGGGAIAWLMCLGFLGFRLYKKPSLRT